MRRHFHKACRSKLKLDRSKLKDKVPKDLDSENDEINRVRSAAKLTLENAERVDILNDIPQDLLKYRKARISQPSKNVMQSAAYNTKHWVVSFNTLERWENPNMGWCSSGDPIANMNLRFPTVKEAVDYCEKSGWKYVVEKSNLKKKNVKQRTYSQNFLDKRCRVSTK